MPSNRCDAAAAERKRLRDRVAQQNLRNKRNRHIQALEEQVNLCRELHGSLDNEHLLSTIRELRAENALLRQRHHRLRALFKSCEEILGQSTCADEPSPTVNSSARRDAESSNTPKHPMPQPPSQTPVSHPGGVQASPALPAAVSSHQLPCSEGIEASNYLPHSSWFQDEINGADGVSFTPSAYPTLDLHLLQPDELARALLDSAHVAPSPNDCSTLPSSATAEQSGMTKDFWLLRPSIPHTQQIRPEFIHPDLPSLDQGISFLDPGLWNVLDFLAERTEDLPDWARIPLRTSSSRDAHLSPWDTELSLILEAPDTPSPLDLLFGSKQNQLASSVQRNVKNWYYGDPERLAIGWLAYHYIKWRTQPTAERYSRLPNCLRPAMEQTRSPHPGCLDLIFWKTLRLNILKSHNKYDIDKFIRLYCACLRLRWSGEEVVVPDDEDTYVVRPDFHQRFMSEDGWGLKSEFIHQYPELFEGLDLRKVVYTV